jgi:hypothetical protein
MKISFHKFNRIQYKKILIWVTNIICNNLSNVNMIDDEVRLSISPATLSRSSHTTS